MAKSNTAIFACDFNCMLIQHFKLYRCLSNILNNSIILNLSFYLFCEIFFCYPLIGCSSFVLHSPMITFIECFDIMACYTVSIAGAALHLSFVRLIYFIRLLSIILFFSVMFHSMSVWLAALVLDFSLITFFFFKIYIVLFIMHKTARFS